MVHGVIDRADCRSHYINTVDSRVGWVADELGVVVVPLILLFNLLRCLLRCLLFYLQCLHLLGLLGLLKHHTGLLLTLLNLHGHDGIECSFQPLLLVLHEGLVAELNREAHEVELLQVVLIDLRVLEDLLVIDLFLLAFLLLEDGLLRVLGVVLEQLYNW
jgi:hypothetical protein